MKHARTPDIWMSDGDTYRCEPVTAIRAQDAAMAAPHPLEAISLPRVEAIPEDITVPQILDNLVSALLGADETQREIVVQGLILTQLLLIKNQNYGNSALAPIAVFARGLSPEQRMGVRMDDKISRIVKGNIDATDGEDPYRDFAGYLILWLVNAALGQKTAR